MMNTSEIKQAIARRQGRRDALQGKPLMNIFGATAREAYAQGYASIKENPPPSNPTGAMLRALRVIDEYRLSQGLDDDSDAYHALVQQIEPILLEMTNAN
jgi:hypothetical protein